MNSRAGNRRGVAIIPVIALFAVAMTLIAVWVKSAISEKRQIVRWHEHLQTEHLARAGVQRAIARLSREGDVYPGETWRVSKDDMETLQDAVVEIRVEPSSANDSNRALPTASSEFVHVVAIADYPAGMERRVRVTEKMELDLTNLNPSTSGE
jgi:type II secretory pathway component PulK